jgi:hypothetical protein
MLLNPDAYKHKKQGWLLSQWHQKEPEIACRGAAF